MLRHCGLDEISAPISPISAPISAPISGARSRAAPLRAVLLLRGDTQQDASLNQTDGDERRAFASPGAVRDELLSALPPGTTLHTFVTAGDAPLCEQVDLMLTPAHNLSSTRTRTPTPSPTPTVRVPLPLT